MLLKLRYRNILLGIGLVVVVYEVFAMLRAQGAFIKVRRRFQTPIDLSDLANTTSIRPPYTAVILYLIQASRLADLRLSLTYLHKNVHTNEPWPIILFYDDPILSSPQVQSEFIFLLYDALGHTASARQFVRRIEWIHLEFNLPPGISSDIDALDPKPVFSHAWPGYHHMCAWFIGAIFNHPRLKDVDYYMRMDTDSFIYDEVCYDPFELMVQKGKVYGYRSSFGDEDWVTKGMWKLVDEYAKENQLVEKRLKLNGWKWPGTTREDKNAFDNSKFPLYYNNFEIVKLEAFRRPNVKAWLDEVMSVPERVYIYRWGDAPVRYATVNMFFDVEKDVELFCGINYYHQGTQSPRCRCEDQLA
ncbi:nucleotide-diphospho-sugar transferase [Crepidotus variabilis]|uniref:Nucleotide-diphospho-sugar transferase n=1 Tax=Crepidotus variabilis TaxID=179855 RepID=A0A9P6E869_9AGAR|nr:nucleotide-diphospho-sugar transferase [Crepidotus variabilis]